MKTSLVAALLAFSLPAFADGVDRRAERQQERIFQGVQSDELTAREAARLQNREARVENTIARDRADGHFSARERAQVQRMENRTSRAIYRQKHDAQAR